MQIGVVGDNTIDRYVGSRQETYVGGNALNVAVQLHRHGRPVHYVGVVGDDPDGALIRAAITSAGLGLDGVRTDPGPSALTCIAVAADGERRFEEERFGVTADFLPGAEQLDALAACAWVHIGMTSRAPQLRAELARRGAGALSQDCAVSRGTDHLDVAFCSVGEDLDRARTESTAALRGGARLAVATCGAAGAYATDGRHEWRQAVVPVDVVDTTGAGDSFIAGFTAARLQGATVPEALTHGAQWAASTCGHVAGWPQDPTGVDHLTTPRSTTSTTTTRRTIPC